MFQRVQVLTSSARLTVSPRSMARLMAYRLVASTGAVTMKADTRPTSTQNWSKASQVKNQPAAVMTKPWARLSQGLRVMSRKPSTSQRRGWSGSTGRMGGRSGRGRERRSGADGDDMDQAYRAGGRPGLTHVNRKCSVVAVAVHAGAADACHEAGGFGIKGLFLLCIQAGIKGFGGIAVFFHLGIALCMQCLHLVDAFGCCQLFHGGAVRAGRHLGRRLHRVSKGFPGTFLAGIELEPGLEFGQMFGVALGHIFTHVFAHVVLTGLRHAGASHRAGLREGTAAQSQCQTGGDQGSADCFHLLLLEKAPARKSGGMSCSVRAVCMAVVARRQRFVKYCCQLFTRAGCGSCRC